MLFGEEPPAERIGRPGGLRGEPLTEEERKALHELYYGPGSSPPEERLGLTALGGGNPVSTQIVRSSDKTTIYRRVVTEDEDVLEPVTITLIAILLIKIAVAAAVLYAGLTAIQSYLEKKARAGLPSFSLSVYEPKPELIDHPDAKYFLVVDGAVSDRKVQIKFGKGKYIGYFDYVFREEYGDYTVEVTGRELAEAAERNATLVGRIPGLRESGDVTIYMYAQEMRAGMRDLMTPIEPVRIHIPGITEKAAEELIPGWVPPLPVSPEDAAEGIAAGRRYYIKFGVPILSLLPGLPYTLGMWVPWGCIITETP